MRQIANNVYIPVLKDLVEEGKEVSMMISGSSKGKWIAPGDFWWEFFEHIWLHLIPFRRFLMKLYGIQR